MAKKGSGKHNVAVLIGTYDENYQARIRSSLIDFAITTGIGLSFIVGRPLHSPIRDDLFSNIVFELARSPRFDGLIIVSGTIGQFITPEQMASFAGTFKPKPMVSIGLEFKDIPSLVIDNRYGVEKAVDHLISAHGVRRIACVRGPQGHPEADARYDGYRKSLKRNGIPLDPGLVVQGDFWIETGYKAVRSLLEKCKTPPEALIMPDDETALGAFRAVCESDLRVPNDIRIVGFDDSDESRFHNPPLASVSQPFKEMTSLAIRMIGGMLDGRKVRLKRILPTVFIPRDSCGCVRENGIKLWGPGKTPRLKGRKGSAHLTLPMLKVFERRLSKVYPGTKRRKTETMPFLRKFLACMIEKRPFASFLPEIYAYTRKYLHDETDYNRVSVILNLFKEMCATEIGTVSAVAKYTAEFIDSTRSQLEQIHMRKNAYEKSDTNRNLAEYRHFNTRLYSIPDLEHMTKNLCDSLPGFGIRSCFFVLYREKPEQPDSVTWRLSLESEIVLAMKDTSRLYIENGRNAFPTALVLPDPFSSFNEGKIFILMPLKFWEEQYGYVIFEHGALFDTAYETLGVYLNSALKVINLFEKQKKTEYDLSQALNSLEQTNTILHSLSLKDELTGLYNRRGFFHLGLQQYEISRRTKQPIALIYMDLDGLKTINDSYGHSEGDWAIRKAGDILQTLFRKSDIIARMGGDEFIIMAVDINEIFLNAIIGRLDTSCKSLDETSGKPFKLQVTCGTHIFRGEDNVSFDELIVLADNALYEIKRRKKTDESKTGGAF